MSLREVHVSILYNKALDSEKIKEVCAGLEEEGVPYLLQEDQRDNSIELAVNAASSSPLQVGIGIDHKGILSIHHEKLHKDKPYLMGDLQNGRGIGKNAARLVKGLPLMLNNKRKRDDR